jgi:hypothetical protein
MSHWTHLNTRQVTFSTPLRCFEYVERASAIRLFALHEATISYILVGGGLSLVTMVTGRRNYSTKTVHTRIASLQAITSPAIQSVGIRVGGVSCGSAAAFAKRSFAWASCFNRVCGFITELAWSQLKFQRESVALINIITVDLQNSCPGWPTKPHVLKIHNLNNSRRSEKTNCILRHDTG